MFLSASEGPRQVATTRIRENQQRLCFGQGLKIYCLSLVAATIIPTLVIWLTVYHEAPNVVGFVISSHAGPHLKQRVASLCRRFLDLPLSDQRLMSDHDRVEYLKISADASTESIRMLLDRVDGRGRDHLVGT